MNISSMNFALAGSCLLLICSSAASAGVAEKDEKAIRDALAAESKAYTDRDYEASLTPYAKDVVVFDIIPPMQHAGIETNRETNKVLWEQSTGPMTVAITNLKVRVDHDHGYAAYFDHVSIALKDGRKIDLHARILDVWEKRKGRWQIILEEASVPVNMVTGKADFSGSEVMQPSIQPVNK